MTEHRFPSPHGELKVNHHEAGCRCGAANCEKGHETAVVNAPGTGVPNRPFRGPLALPKALRELADWMEHGLPTTRLHPQQEGRLGRSAA
jgi:hypothetical protein